MRLERKYILRGESIHAVESFLWMHPAGFSKAHPRRTINNIYFDTIDRSAFYENSEGVGERTKYRVRWYGNQWQPILQPVFEAKVKKALVGHKNTFPLPEKIAWQNLLDELRQIPMVNRNHLIPVMVNSYQREYYHTFDKRFRMTLDFDLQFGAYTENGAPPMSTLDGIIIAELKYPSGAEKEIDQVTQYWPFRLTRFSKFATGMAVLTGTFI